MIQIDDRHWPAVADALPRPWPEALAEQDVGWWRRQVEAGERRSLPGREYLAGRWGLSVRQVRRIMGADQPASQERTGAEPAPCQERASGERTNAENYEGSYQPRASAVPAASQERATPPPPSRPSPPNPPSPPTPAPEGVPRARTHEAPPAPPFRLAEPLEELPDWVPSKRDCAGWDRRVLFESVLEAVGQVRTGGTILGDPEGCKRPVAAKAATDARQVVRFWRSLGQPDPAELARDVALVARWARESPDRLAARDIRGEGWDGAVDRSRSVATLTVQLRWADRLAAAQTWRDRGMPRVEASATTNRGAEGRGQYRAPATHQVEEDWDAAASFGR